MISQATSSGVISLYGDGSLRRSFTHIDDLCSIFEVASKSHVAANKTYNLPGEDFSLLQVALLLCKKYDARIVFNKWPELDYSIESGSTVFDSSLIARDLCVSTQITMESWLDLY